MDTLREMRAQLPPGSQCPVTFMSKPNPLARRADDAIAAVARLVDSQQADARLVALLLSYLNDNLSEREKGRLGAELTTRDLSDHAERRAAVLARVQGGAS
ncbi:hypothetical protein [Marilutibacter aestuarii]|uniref:hypothetical protein n=1 Tax=Marilutibacter aestuarii TaxID=1706195 RepID=UPI00114481FB|nr:hypothetical protein [Lysobacter aestuarii]